MLNNPRLWHIYHVKNCRHAKPAPKSKFIAIVCQDEAPMGFMINTKLRPWILKRPHRRASQVLIAASHHPFLVHDSYVDCTELYEFADGELNNLRGAISGQAKRQIRNAVAASLTLARRHKELILG